MKHISVITLFVLFFAFNMLSQTPGSLDTDFGIDGIRTIHYPGQNARAYGIAFQSDGKMVLCGLKGSGSNWNVYSARLNQDGYITTYGNMPNYFFHDMGDISEGRCISVLPDDRILIAGERNYEHVFLMRLTQDGILDGTMGGGNGYFIYLELNNVEDMIITTEGSDTYVFFTGYYQDSPDNFPVIVKTDQDGYNVSSFGDNGVFMLESVNAKIYCIDIDHGTGMIYIAGQSGDDGFILRCNHLGQLDPAFGGSGYITLPPPEATGFRIKKIIVDQDNHYVTAFGYAESNATWNDYEDIYACRINVNGTLNTNFGVNGWSFLHMARGDMIHDAVQQSDGKYYFGGSSDFYSGPPDFFNGRINHYGFFDPSFGSSGMVYTDLGGDEYCSSLLLDEEEGRLIACGTGSDTDEMVHVACYHTGFFVNSKENAMDVSVKVFPNPILNNTISFSISLSEAKSINFSLCSIEGKEIISSYLGDLTQGYHEISLSVPENTYNGIYILNVTSNKFAIHKKLIYCK